MRQFIVTTEQPKLVHHLVRFWNGVEWTMWLGDARVYSTKCAARCAAKKLGGIVSEVR